MFKYTIYIFFKLNFRYKVTFTANKVRIKKH